AAGLFLAASQFPKNRETRAPYLDELVPHQNEIDPKYQFLMRAPLSDPEGRRALVKFGRQTKAHFVATEVEKGKASGWRADFDEATGLWVESETVKPAKKPVKKAKAKGKAKAKAKAKAKVKAKANPKATAKSSSERE
ncbi:MAG: hypothetical protein ACPG9T_13775, partial [Pseudomonadales bacterium]